MPSSSRLRPARTTALISTLAALLLALPLPASSARHAVPELVPWALLDDDWGTWLPERQWGTPREAVDGDGWGMDWEDAITTEYRTFDDGIAGWTDRAGTFRLGWAFWDGRQPHVTERFDGDTNAAGAAGETIREDRVFEESSPTHSYARMTYRYPYPDRTFRVRLEAARVTDDRLVFRAVVRNVGKVPAALHVLFKAWLAPGGHVEGAPGLLDLVTPAATLRVGSRDLDAWQVSDQKGAIDAGLRAGGLSGGGSGHIGVLGTRLDLAAGETASVRVGAAEEGRGGETAAPGSPVRLERGIGAILSARRGELTGLYRGEVAAHEDLYRDSLMDLLWSRALYRWDGATSMDSSLAGTVAADDVLVMPDRWEYPWIAGWDAAFHAVTAARIDPRLGATELRFLLSPRWQQPDGHVPCGEWVMARECPPLFAWAALRIADLDVGGGSDLLAELLPALERHYAYWWDRLQVGDAALFFGGFMGMDNLPGRTIYPQADASGWMALFAGQLAEIARRLGDPEREARYGADRRAIAGAVNEALWDEATGFYYDAADRRGESLVLVPSYTGLVPLIAGIAPPERAERILVRLRDEAEFLSPGGIRSLSAADPLYVPGAAGAGVNSNWRGPVWVPMNLLLVETLDGLDPELAMTVRERVVDNVERRWRETGRLWESFDGDSGAGLGADAQAGWTASVAVLIAEGWPR